MAVIHGITVAEKTYAVVDGPTYFDTWRSDAARERDPHVRVHVSDASRSGWAKFATTGTEVTGVRGPGGIRPRRAYGSQTSVSVETGGVNGEGNHRLLVASIAAVALGEGIASGGEFDVAYPAPPIVIDVARSLQPLADDHRVRLISTDDIYGDPRRMHIRTTGVDDFNGGMAGVVDRRPVGHEMIVNVTADRLEGPALEQMAVNIAALAFKISSGEFAA